MPNVLEVPETTQKQQYQRRQETAEVGPTKSSAPRRFRGMATVARLLGFPPQAQQRWSMIVDSPKAEMQPIDRLTRDFPFLFIQASGV